MSEHDLMKLLYQLGFQRAAILDRDVLNGSLRRMFFKIQTVQMSQRSLRVKEPTPWLLNQPANKPFLPFYDHIDASLNESSNQGSSIKILWPFQFSAHIALPGV